MFKTVIRQKSIPEILETQPNAIDKFALCDVGGLVEFARAQGLHCHVPLLERGNDALTAATNKYIQVFEDQVFVGHGWHNADDVVGAVPNISAFLAGHPQCMRRRMRTRSERAPLTILFETTGSGGTMATRAPRGAAMLALARMLANTRPVELWILTTYGKWNEMNMVAVKIDTAPLDTARSALMLSSIDGLLAVSEVNRKMLGGGSWSYGIPELERRWSGEALRRVIEPASELLFIPATWLDDLHDNPVKWIRQMLNKYGMGAVEREED